jgi:hypothetical protein
VLGVLRHLFFPLFNQAFRQGFPRAFIGFMPVAPRYLKFLRIRPRPSLRAEKLSLRTVTASGMLTCFTAVLVVAERAERGRGWSSSLFEPVRLRILRLRKNPSRRSACRFQSGSLGGSCNFRLSRGTNWPTLYRRAVLVVSEWSCCIR